jgi:hypothetical protein
MMPFVIGLLEDTAHLLESLVDVVQISAFALTLRDLSCDAPSLYA